MSDEFIHIVFDDLIRSFQTNGSRIALIERDGSTHTYADFKARIVGAQHELKKRSVGKGSKVLVFVPMSVDLYAILEALFSLGATVIFLDPWMKGKKMSQVIRQVQPDLFVVTKKINRLARLLPATWFLKKWKFEHVLPLDGNWEIERVQDAAHALITFTSGTSGQPKGASRSFAFLHAQSTVLKEHLIHPNGNHYVELTNFPIVALADFAMGNTVVIPDVNLMKIHEADGKKVVEQIKAHGVNRLIVSPALLKRILASVKNPGDLNLDEIITGGAPISNTLLTQCCHQFPAVKLEGIYGSTEAEPICITSFQEMIQAAKTPLHGIYTGYPVGAVQVKIIQLKTGPISTEEFQHLVLGESEIGEVVVTGNHVNKNYYENEGAFRKFKITDTHGQIWHRTGDMGYLTKGKLYLVGRDHRVMKNKDRLFYPYPLEQFIEQRFGFTDVGYIQDKKGLFILYLGNCQAPVDFLSMMNEIRSIGYPIDKIQTQRKALPRDARHKSKLQVEALD